MGFLLGVFATLLTFQLLGLVALSWWIVFTPILVMAGFWLLILFLVFMGTMGAATLEMKRRK